MDSLSRLIMKYAKKSLCGPIFEEELDEMIDMLQESGYLLDDAYLEHIAQNHGGRPITKYFRHGEIVRFLNFTDSYTASNANVRQFNVNVVRNLIKDRIGKNIVPFASLPHGAFLCFDYSTTAVPKIVMWNNESFSEEYVNVEDSFSDLINSLSDTPHAA